VETVVGKRSKSIRLGGALGCCARFPIDPDDYKKTLGGEIFFSKIENKITIEKVKVQDELELVEVTKVNKNEYCQALLRLRSIAFHIVTLRDHLGYIHLTYSNYLTQVAAEIKESNNDPLNLVELLQPHIFGTLEKNVAAFQNLFNENGILMAAMDKTHDFVINSMKKFRVQFINSFQTFDTWKKNVTNNMIKETLYFKRGIHCHNAITDYVNAYLNNQQKLDEDKIKFAYSNVMSSFQEMGGDKSLKYNLKDLLIELIWRVIYYHYQVGTVLPYLYDSKLIMWDIEKSSIKDGRPSSNSLWTLVVAFATSSRQKQLISMENPFSDRNQKVWTQFIHILDNYADADDQHWLLELEPSVAR